MQRALIWFPLAAPLLLACARPGAGSRSGASVDVPGVSSSTAPLALVASPRTTCTVPEPKGKPTELGQARVSSS